MVSFNTLPNCKGAVGNSTLLHSPTLQGRSCQGHLASYSHSFGGARVQKLVVHLSGPPHYMGGIVGCGTILHIVILRGAVGIGTF